jgi:hypothetical protein
MVMIATGLAVMVTAKFIIIPLMGGSVNVGEVQP